MQIDLFENNKKTNETLANELANRIIGLKLYHSFISPKEEKELLHCIDKSIWLSDLKRRVQHYGYKYDYRAKKIDNTYFLGELPVWLKVIAQKMIDSNAIDFIPDQAIINEYETGQGIAPHIDCEPCFGDTIISLSLGSTCIMNFEQASDLSNKIGIFIEPRTLLVMQDESRYKWLHSIPQRKSDSFNDHIIRRNRRVSITFRKVKLN